MSSSAALPMFHVCNVLIRDLEPGPADLTVALAVVTFLFFTEK